MSEKIPKFLHAALLLGTLAHTPPAEAKHPQEKTTTDGGVDTATIKAWSLNDPDFFTTFPRGEFSATQKKQRTKTLPNGEIVFQDVGLTFYQVASGDTRANIIKKLSQYPQYTHLTTQTEKLKSFNIPDRSLKAGMWIPIPLANRERELADPLFAKFASLAITDLWKHPEYGSTVQAIVKKAGRLELVASMLAVAKQESGGLPLGQFELHRWEKRHHRFSFSLFHILMTDHGLTARRKLNLTEGQLYHPENAAKLFLGFVIEKTNRHRLWLEEQQARGKRLGETVEKAEDFFPFNAKNLLAFARFYNGAAWRRINPNYAKNLARYHGEAWDLLHPGSTKKPSEIKLPKETPPPHHAHPKHRPHKKHHRGHRR